jgi:drug/metabolite transporter (DMT)-like permease
MRYTSVATGTALAAMQPIFAAIFTTFLGGHIPKPAWLGMAISFIGVLVITGVDLQLSWRAFIGDIAGLVSGALSAAYVIIGSQAQQKISTFTYTTACYAATTLTAFPIIFLLKQRAFGYSHQDWLLLLALIASAQILGHTMFNFALKRVSPTVVSLIVFFEVPVAALLAWWWLNQTPPQAVIPGIILILVGCGVFVLRSQKSAPKSS